LNKKLILSLLAILGLVTGCGSHHQAEQEKVIEVNGYPKDISMPKAFIQKIEEDLAAESKVLNPVYLFIPIQIAFAEKSHDTLVAPALQYAFPKGGGTLDLSTIVKGQGSFYFSFPPEQFKEKDMPELEHLFYVSQSPVTKIDGEEFGLGCGKWLDLKKNFPSLQKKDFLRLNTTGNRHLHVLAGSYVFVFRKSNQVLLTQITLTDSKNKSNLCPEIAAEGADQL